jgi:hypothetical protein
MFNKRVELVDTQDLKSCGCNAVPGSLPDWVTQAGIPAPGTRIKASDFQRLFCLKILNANVESYVYR